ncbi:MAG: hypothetical protein L0215_03290 [Gemmataceae bacterium]|nr:hypothetical protein [Gemmataceae bacterium]
MDVVNDEIVEILHGDGIEQDGVFVDRYVIVLKTGRSIELTDKGPIAAACEGLKRYPAFDYCIGLRIVSIENGEPYPSCGIRLSNGCILVMGSPHPYYVGLQEAEA